MVWNKKDYPDSWKNLDERTRNKAIEIANALVEDGYEEGRAIPIATSQAKKWAQDDSDEGDSSKGNKQSSGNKKNSTTGNKKNSTTGEKEPEDSVLVRYREKDDKWEVISQGASRPDSLHDSKREAQARAKEIADNKQSKVISYKKGEQ